MSTMQLVWPSMEYLAGYADALRRGWSPDTVRPEAAAEELARIEADAQRFITEQVDRDATGPRYTLKDGSTVARIPGYRRWMWDGEFCGSIGFRWQKGTTDLPPTCLGHIGYTVVPWKQRRGYATRALELLLKDIRLEHEQGLLDGLDFIDITTQIVNVPSQRVILANGGVLVETFSKVAAHGGGEALRYRVRLDAEGVS